jgi:hypothetical protein
MPKTAPARKDRKDDEFKWKATTWQRRKQWENWENVGLQPVLTLNDLDLRWADPRVRGLDILGATESIVLERTIDGASTLTIKVRDPFDHIFSQAAKRVTTPRLTPAQRRALKSVKYRYKNVDEGWEPILRPNLQGQACQVNLNGAKFRLVKVACDYAEDSATLTFEDLIVYLLKRVTGERRASRRKVTRAQFVLSQLREVKSIKPPFICPELMIKQPVDKGTASPSAKSTASRTTGGGSGGDAGFSPNARLFGADASGSRYEITGDRKANAARVLAAADKITSDQRARIALVEACNIENQWSNSAVHNDADSEGILQARVGFVGHENATNIDYCVGRFLNGPSWTGAQGGKGAVALAKAFPSWSEGQIAQTIQGSAYPSRYDKTKSAAVDLLRQWGGAGGSPEGAATSYDVTYSTAYQFARDKDESAYTSIKRLGDEVNWKFFPVGEAVYFMSEEQLFNRRIRYTFRPGDNAILNLTYDADWGKPVSQCVVTVALDRWGAPPGAVVELEGWEVPDGRWLITGVRRDWFQPTAEVTLSQPGKAALEPAEEQKSRTVTTPGGTQSDVTDPNAGDKVNAAYAAAQEATRRNWTYSQPLRNRQDSGYADCSSGVSWVLNRAGIQLPGPMTPNAPVSGAYETWGAAGPGEHMTIMCNGGHIWIRWTGMGMWRFDTGSGSGGRLWPTARSISGFVQRHWPGT